MNDLKISNLTDSAIFCCDQSFFYLFQLQISLRKIPINIYPLKEHVKSMSEPVLWHMSGQNLARFLWHEDKEYFMDYSSCMDGWDAG